MKPGAMASAEGCGRAASRGLLQFDTERPPLASCDELVPIFDRLFANATAQLGRRDDVAFDLCLTWLCRLLVSKLLEARLGEAHLDGRRITRYRDLDELLSATMHERYPRVPFRDAPLFEQTQLERETIRLADLDDATGDLTELWRILDARDFGSAHAAGLVGLVFERINAHAHGSFYTPPELAAFMCRETIRRAVADTPLDAIRILDPAVGVGHFLVAALDELVTIRAEHGLLDPDDPAALRAAKRSIIERNLFGVDIDERAAAICRLRLWLELGDADVELAPNIECADALTLDERPEFDVVVANPPFMSAIEMSRRFPAERRAQLKSRYASHRGPVDLYVLFFELALRLLRSGGHAALLTPNKFLAASYGQALREHLASHATLVKLVDYGRARVFRDAGVYPVVSVLSKAEQAATPVLTAASLDGAPPERYRSVPASELEALPGRIWGFLLNDKLALTRKVLDQCEPLSAAGKINATSTASEAAAIHEHIREGGRGLRMINTGTIDPWVSLWGQRELRDKGRGLRRPTLAPTASLRPAREALYRSAKIVFAKSALRVEAYYDEAGRYASINTNCIHSFAPDFDPRYVLGWVHSRLFHYVYSCLFDSVRMNGGYLPYNAPNLRAMGIKRMSAAGQREIVVVVDRILRAKQRDARRDVSDEERALDELFAAAFGLDGGERADAGIRARG